MQEIKLSNERIVVTGKGRVGAGILEILKKLNITEKFLLLII